MRRRREPRLGWWRGGENKVGKVSVVGMGCPKYLATRLAMAHLSGNAPLVTRV